MREGQGMTHNAADAMKTRLRSDLHIAMKEGRTNEAKLIRTLIAAIDNSEAPQLESNQQTIGQHQFHDRSAEIERLALTQTQVQEILMDEIIERETAAADLLLVNRSDLAEALQNEAKIVCRHIEK